MSNIKKYRIIETLPGIFYVQQRYFWFLWKNLFYRDKGKTVDIFYTSYTDAWSDLQTYIKTNRNTLKLGINYFDEEGNYIYE